VRNYEGIRKYQDLNEENYQRSQEAFNSRKYIDEARDRVQERVKADDQFVALRQSVIDAQDYWRSRSQAYELGTFGDIWNMTAPVFEMPEAPGKIEADYD